MVPDLWIEEHGRIGEFALGRTALVTVAVALAPLTVRGQGFESVEGVSSSRSLSSRERSRRDLRITPALVLGETGLDPRIDTGLAVTGCGLLTATDYVDSMRVPPLAGVLAVTARGHAISLVVLEGDYLPPLTVRNQGRKDGEPDVSSRRVWRR